MAERPRHKSEKIWFPGRLLTSILGLADILVPQPVGVLGQRQRLPPRVLIRVPAAPRTKNRRELCIRAGIALLRQPACLARAALVFSGTLYLLDLDPEF